MKKHRLLMLPPLQTVAIIFTLLIAVNTFPATAESSSKRVAVATRLNGASIRLDGSLDEDLWEDALYTSGFFQRDPEEGSPSTERTDVAFFYDDQALYVGARLEKSDGNEIIATVSRRDNPGNSEAFIITLDTYHDRRTSYSFAVTATGVRVDYYHASDSEGNRDYSYDPVWEAKVARTEFGWTAEMRIPFSQLRFNDTDSQIWGLNMNRWIPNGNEDTYWVYIPKNETGWASRFGELQGIEAIRASRRVELMPYFASNATVTNDFDEDDPFTDGRELKGRMGGDLKMGVGPNLTFEAAFNPDFGQVEADPAEVNLSAFETFFDEKRPFFIEGSQLLAGNGASYFYSRRIGAAPHGGADGDFINSPDNTTIIGAGKLTGRLSNGLSIGGLGAITSREYANTSTALVEKTGSEIDTLDVRDKVKVEPLTGYGVLRLQQEFGEDHSTAGLSFTGVARDLGESKDLASILNRQAYAGGGDLNVRFRGGEYVLGGAAGFSYIEGDSAAVLRAQRSSRRYFQRPDADHVDVDSSRTSLGGYTYASWFERNGGKHWLWGLGTSGESPGFEINDAGRLRSADDIEGWANLTYRDNKPGKIFRNYSARINTNHGWNFGGVKQNTTASLNLNGTWDNFWSSWAGVWTGFRVKSDALTRGGPLMETLDVWSAWFGTQNSFASNNSWFFNLDYARDELDTWNFNVNGRYGFKPGERWEVSLEPRYSQSIDGRQFITSQGRGAESSRPGATFNRRYIFSWIDRSTLSTQFRLNYSLSPDLSIEVYTEPFASSGRFYDYGELEREGGRLLQTYGREGGTELSIDEDGTRRVTDGGEEFELGNDDFNVLSFRSNAVLRWEWRPGSTFFLVWQQNRAESSDEGSLVGGRDLFDTFNGEGENFFAAKISYWIPIQ